MNARKLKLGSIALFCTLTFTFQARADWPPEDLWYKCRGCHGMDGKANTAIGVKQKIPDFTSPKWQEQRTDEDIRKVIAEGSKKKGSKMKPFKNVFTPAEIDSLIPYIRKLAEPR